MFYVALLALTGASCNRKARPADAIVLLTESPIGRLDPRLALGAWEVRVSRLVAPGLTAPGYPPGEAGLAQTVKFRDARTVEVTLHDDAWFSSGRQVHAEDVAFTFRSILNPATQSPYRSALVESLDTVEVLDARRVLFHLKLARSSFAADLQMGIVDRHFAAVVDKRGIDVIGAGPYKIIKVSHDRVELAANPHPTVTPASAIIVRTIRDDNARIVALLGGSGDAILNGITPQVLQALKARPDLRVATARSATVTYLGFNLQDPILGNASVRKAITMGIDRAKLISARFDGQAQIADSLLARDNPFHSDQLDSNAFNPALAAQMLDAAGFPDPDSDGPLPRFTLVWKSSNNRFRVSVAEAIAKQLSRLGIAVEVRPFDFATLMEDLRHSNFQLFSLQMTDVYEPDWLRSTYHSTRSPSLQNGWTGLNRFHFADPTVDALLDEGAGTLETKERRRIYAEVQRRVADAVPCFPLWHENNVLVTRKAVERVGTPRTGGLEVFLNARVAGDSR